MNKGDFEIGQLVVYPAHGVGVVVGIETQNVADVEIDVVVVLFDKDKMTIRLPINDAIHTKIRKLCSKEEMAGAIEHLRTPVKVKKTMWSRRAQEYEMKINSGNPVFIAQVIRDLHRKSSQPEHSYSERQIYQEALDRLIREYAAVEQVDLVKATDHLEKLLNAA